MSGRVTNDDLLKIAKNLVTKYASTRLVVTSRIHAGLPCLGLHTPVIFVANKEVTSEAGSFNTPGRLEGLLEFFRILNLDHGKFTCDDAALSSIDIFTLDTHFENKNNWISYAQELDKKAGEFMKKGAG